MRGHSASTGDLPYDTFDVTHRLRTNLPVSWLVHEEDGQARVQSQEWVELVPGRELREPNHSTDLPIRRAQQSHMTMPNSYRSDEKIFVKSLEGLSLEV